MNAYTNNYLTKNGHPAGRIFEILNVVTGDNYIGCTTSPLNKRLSQVFSASKEGKAGLLYDDVRAWGKECFEIKCIYECTLDEDKEKCTMKYIYENNPSLNINKDEWLNVL